MSQIMKTDATKSLLFQQLRELSCYVIRFDPISNFINVNVIQIVFVIGTSAQLLIRFLLTFDVIRSKHGTYGTGVMVQQHAMFRPRIEQWLRQIISGDRSFFAAKIKTRLYTA